MARRTPRIMLAILYPTVNPRIRMWCQVAGGRKTLRLAVVVDVVIDLYLIVINAPC
jgi:hypothetical protein